MSSLSSSEWEHRYLQLEQRYLELERKYIKSEERITLLEEENRALREKLNTNSSNSSTPPSQDPYRPRHKVKSSGKKPGGQPGHPVHKRQLYPEEAITASVDLKPVVCPDCQSKTFHETPVSIECRQVIELPPIQAEVTQYNIYTCSCCQCAKHVRAVVPSEAERGFGPRLMGFLTLLSGEAHLTKRKICALAGHLGIRISLGALCKIHRLAAVILEGPYEAIRQEVLRGRHINGDETGWRQGKQRHWLWVGVGEGAMFFKIDPSRSQVAFKRVFGEFSETLTSDRYGAYNAYQGVKQSCLAHIDRDFEKVAEREGLDGSFGKILKRELGEIFAIWQSFREGKRRREEMQKAAEGHVFNIRSALTVGAEMEEVTKKTRRFCNRILSCFTTLWTFLTVEGIEPTNNRAERALRPAVIIRKLSGGSQSDWGERFTERILTVISTLKQQAKNVLHYLSSVFGAHIRAGPIPSVV